MSRIQILIASVVVVMALFTGLAIAQKPDAIKPGEPYTGDIPSTARLADKKTQIMVTNAMGRERGDTPRNFPPTFYLDQVPITLSAGQKIEIQATMSGDNRKVFLFLADPAGKSISKIGNNEALRLKTFDLKVDEVGSTGVYQIFVITDRVGTYKLQTRASGVEPPPAEDEDAAQLEAKIARLERELADAKKKLNALKAKSGNKKK